MDRFVTLDLNGWLDHLVVGGADDPKPEARTLGFRSCLFEFQDTWLFGAQALSAARDTCMEARLLDAIDALAFAAGYQGNCADTERDALPLALWQLVSDISIRSNDATHLAVVVPDGRFLGRRQVDESGRTALESLHDALREKRPTSLGRSRLELVWRSVAALRAAMDRSPEKFVAGPGSVLVISVNRRTFWTVLELRCRSSHGEPDVDPAKSFHIVRKPAMDDCDPHEAWTMQRLDAVHSAFREEASEDLEALNRWTRSTEMLATGMSPKSLAELGVDTESLEHWSWPTAGREWRCWKNRPEIKRFPAVLPSNLKLRVEAFMEGREGEPLAIVIESPAGIEMTSPFEKAIRAHAPVVPIVRVTGRNTAQAAMKLAHALGRDPDTPAWLDAVPAIELEIQQGNSTTWNPIVAEGKAIPAGETYHTPRDPSRRVTLSPGIEHVHLHLRRGEEDNWDERYTEHEIPPSDHQRTVEPRARVRPLSGEARIEIVERRPDGEIELLASSRSSVRWRDMERERPATLRSIPELYVFKASEQGWPSLEPLLERAKNAGVGSVEPKLKDAIYKAIQSRWNEQSFPLGSDGLPHRVSDQEVFRARSKLLTDSTGVLLEELDQAVNDVPTLKAPVANRLHLPLTWLFTGCPERVVEILLDAVLDPQGRSGRTLQIDNDFSAWSIYSGIGRAVRSDDALRTIFDELIGAWEAAGGERQDKFLLAAVTHPLARRVNARRILGECEERFDRVKSFLWQQSQNVLRGISDRRPGNQARRSLELRYVTMGYRGLCQMRYQHDDWFPSDGKDAREAYSQLCEAQRFGRPFEKDLIDRTAPYLIGEGQDPTMPGGF